jgi:hypothetical protein
MPRSALAAIRFIVATHAECRFEFPLEVRSQLLDLADGTALLHSEPVLLTK